MIVLYNALLYLALIRPVFCIGAIVKPNRNKVCKKCSFFGKFGVLCFLVTPNLRFALLPY